MFNKNKEIDRLRNKINDLSKDIEYYKVSNDELNDKIKSLEKLESDLDCTIDNLRVMNTSYKNDLAELKQQLQEQKEVNEKYVQDYRDVTGQNKIYKEAYMNLKNQMDQEIELANKLTNANIEKDNIIASQEAAIKGIINKEFDKDHIEYAALKTYRNWEYIYHNGRFLSTDAKSINAYYDQDDPLRVDFGI